MVPCLPCPEVSYRGPLLEPGMGARHNGESLVGAKSFGWQPKAGTLVVQSPTAEASSRDVFCHLPEGEEAGSGARG